MLASVPGLALIGAGALSPQAAVRILGIAAGAIGIAVSGIVRDRGRRLQPHLWESWGGSPSVRRLRWRDAVDPERVRRLHERLNRLLGWRLPTRDEERRDPVAADRRYEDAVEMLRTRTRDVSRFRLIFAENTEYGYRRNALGIRLVAVAVAIVALTLSIALGVFSHDKGHWTRWGIAAVVSATCFLYWLLIVSPEWVRRAGELYADRLFEAVDTLDTQGR